MFPILNRYGHVVLQAQGGDVHTVVVNGRVVKYENRLVGDDLSRAQAAVAGTVEYLVSTLGEETWISGMHPEVPERSIRENPYQYTDFGGDFS